MPQFLKHAEQQFDISTMMQQKGRW